MSRRKVSFNGSDVDSVGKSTAATAAASHNDVIGGGRFRREKKRLKVTVSGIRGISGGTLGLLRRIRAVVAKALRLSSMSKKSSRKVRSSSATATAKARFSGPVGVDSHREEAIDDCIEFLNSSTASAAGGK
ncbi:uncharacterized protein LOC124933728 [Impatiens glandulifera]|uniref:uncharacterized protein LOC124933728 n=1 Tax=Impatiens glandulifera TaxID=253017 RepID=UPI001FB0782C|nr:uncharacterized protein LOC124933728 [Impatiens glandulifera]